MRRWSAVVVLIGLLGALFLLDRLYLPGHNLAVLYVLPILLASRFQPPRTTILICCVALVLDVIGSLIQAPPSSVWPLTLVGLVIIAGLAVDGSIRRQLESTRDRELHRRIALAEQIRQPLTIVLGRAQYLMSHAREEQLASLGAIEDSARRIETIVRRMLADG